MGISVSSVFKKKKNIIPPNWDRFEQSQFLDCCGHSGGTHVNQISVKFCVVLIPILKFCEEKAFRVILAPFLKL
jgi:hypothetical protein